MSENAWRKGGAPSGTSAMFVPVNTRRDVDELIQGIIVQSGNDAASPSPRAWRAPRRRSPADDRGGAPHRLDEIDIPQRRPACMTRST